MKLLKSKIKQSYFILDDTERLAILNNFRRPVYTSAHHLNMATNLSGRDVFINESLSQNPKNFTRLVFWRLVPHNHDFILANKETV